MSQNRSSHSGADTTCSKPDLCYDRLTTQCVPCVKPVRHSRSESSCSLSGLCFDHQSKQCVSCGPRSRHLGTSTSCPLPSLCYDRLVEQCVSCEKMQRNTEKETTASIKTQAPAPVAADPVCSSLLFGIYIVTGLLLAVAAVLCIVILKQKKKKKKKMQAAEKENSSDVPKDFRCCEEESAKENEKCVIAFQNEPHKGHSCSPGDGGPEMLRCPHSNNTLNTARDDALKREVQHIVMAGNDVTVAASLTSCDKICTPTFPLPAMELGATVLVTTKTTQESIIWDKEEEDKS